MGWCFSGLSITLRIYQKKETLGKWKNREPSVKVIGPLERQNALILLVLKIVYIRENDEII